MITRTYNEGCTTRIGSVRFMSVEGIAVPPEITVQQAESHALGHSLLLVAFDGKVVGAIELQPTLRPEARQRQSPLLWSWRGSLQRSITCTVSVLSPVVHHVHATFVARDCDILSVPN